MIYWFYYRTENALAKRCTLNFLCVFFLRVLGSCCVFLMQGEYFFIGRKGESQRFDGWQWLRVSVNTVIYGS